MNTKIKNSLIALALTGVLFTGACGSDGNTSDAPEACVVALDTVEELVQGPVVEQQTDSITLVGLVVSAFDAGLSQDASAVDSIISELDSLTADAEDRNVKIEALVSEYNQASNECRGE